MRVRAATVAAATVLATLGLGVLTLARGDSPAARVEGLAGAHAELVGELKAVARGPLGALRWRVEPGSRLVACETVAGAPAGNSASASFGLEAPLEPADEPAPFVRAAARAWRERGYAAVRVEGAGQEAAVVSARRGGTLMELVVNPGRRRAYLGGSTACLARRGGG